MPGHRRRRCPSTPRRSSSGARAPLWIGIPISSRQATRRPVLHFDLPPTRLPNTHADPAERLALQRRTAPFPCCSHRTPSAVAPVSRGRIRHKAPSFPERMSRSSHPRCSRRSRTRFRAKATAPSHAGSLLPVQTPLRCPRKEPRRGVLAYMVGTVGFEPTTPSVSRTAAREMQRWFVPLNRRFSSLHAAVGPQYGPVWGRFGVAWTLYVVLLL